MLNTPCDDTCVIVDYTRPNFVSRRKLKIYRTKSVGFYCDRNSFRNLCQAQLYLIGIWTAVLIGGVDRYGFRGLSATMVKKQHTW